MESIKLLLVDDLEENLLALEAVLRREGIELMRARSGGHALELLLKHDFALAIIDVHMPDMSGFELAEIMRGTDRTRRIPIIFLTAGVPDLNRQFRGYESGAVDFLYKPFDPQILAQKRMSLSSWRCSGKRLCGSAMQSMKAKSVCALR